jgi:hypothetical protein
MKKIMLSVLGLAMFGTSTMYAQAVNLTISDLQAVGVSVASQRVAEIEAIRVVKDPAVKEFDEPTFAKLKGIRFRNGTIEVKVLSKLLKNAPDLARGFIGIAFRINEDNSKFECIYLRPQNSRVENQLRRNRSTQYFSFPDFKFERLRKEAPGEYESYVDIDLNEWIDVKIVVKGAQAKLFIHGHKQPYLVVNDLKHGPEASGAVGLFVDVGTEGYFSDLRIRND